MFAFPAVVAIVSLAFGVTVLTQWSTKRRRQQLIWGIALLMAAAASIFFAGFLNSGSELLFRLYYAFGGLLMAPYLGMGSLYLALNRRTADMLLAALTIVGLLGIALILTTPIDISALHRLQQTSGAGTGVLKTGLWLVPLILLNIFGAAAVILVALYSAYRVRLRQAPPRFFVANLTIAAGTGIVSAAGGSARLGANFFWVLMAIGWVVIFAGFLLTTNLASVATIGSRDRSIGREATPV